MPSSSGVLQLAARGVQDAVLYGDSTTSSLTVWRSVHARYSSFAIDEERLEFTTGMGFGSSSQVQIARYGDLAMRMTLEITLPGLYSTNTDQIDSAAATWHAHYTNAVGWAAWEYCELEVGGTTVDQIYSDYAFLVEELFGRSGLRLTEQIGRVLYSPTVDQDLEDMAKKQQKLYVPLPFFFSKYQPDVFGLSLPLVGLSYHEVRLKIKTHPLSDVVVHHGENAAGVKALSTKLPNKRDGTGVITPSDLQMSLLVSYVYLSQEEREAAASVATNFVISTSQRQIVTVAESTATKIENKFYFNHPTSSLIWFYRPNNWNQLAGRRQMSCGYKDRYDFSFKETGVSDAAGNVLYPTAEYEHGHSADPLRSVSLTLNGHNRWPIDMEASYFRTQVPYCTWRQIPSTFIYTFSFGLQSAQWNPTSTLNFSRIDHASLGTIYQTGILDGELHLYGESYNLFVVENGVGSIVYSS